MDLGIISEDIIPNVRLNTEDGLSTVLNNLQEDDAESQPRSYIPPSPPVPLGQFSNDKRALEDVVWMAPLTQELSEPKIEMKEHYLGTLLRLCGLSTEKEVRILHN